MCPSDLPDEMVSAEPLTMPRSVWDALLATYGNGEESDTNDLLCEAVATRKALVEARLALYRELARLAEVEEDRSQWIAVAQDAELQRDDAEARLAEVEEERDDANRLAGTFAELHDKGQRDMQLALADSQAECAELREVVRGFCNTWNDGCSLCRSAHIIALAAFDRPTGTQDALREVCEKVAHAAKGPRPTRIASDGGEYYLTDEEWNARIVARVLGGHNAASE